MRVCCICGLEKGLSFGIGGCEIQLGVAGWLTAMHMLGVLEHWAFVVSGCDLVLLF